MIRHIFYALRYLYVGLVLRNHESVTPDQKNEFYDRHFLSLTLFCVIK